MASNKIKRNIWLTLTILSTAAAVDRIIRVIDGTIEWWQLISAGLITCFCLKFYLCYRRQVKSGNLYGRIKGF